MENWMPLIYDFCKIVLIPLIGVVSGYLIKLINQKGKELDAKIDNETASKYINMLTATISDCVAMTSQTYVDSLKENGEFDILAQKEALNKTKDAVLASLSEEAKAYLTSLYGDFNSYVLTKIEATVKEQK